MTDDFDRLRELERESEEWCRTRRPQHTFLTQCEGYRDQEDREDEIDRLRKNIYPLQQE